MTFSEVPGKCLLGCLLDAPGEGCSLPRNPAWVKEDRDSGFLLSRLSLLTTPNSRPNSFVYRVPLAVEDAEGPDHGQYGAVCPLRPGRLSAGDSARARLCGRDLLGWWLMHLEQNLSSCGDLPCGPLGSPSMLVPRTLGTIIPALPHRRWPILTTSGAGKRDTDGRAGPAAASTDPDAPRWELCRGQPSGDTGACRPTLGSGEN